MPPKRAKTNPPTPSLAVQSKSRRTKLSAQDAPNADIGLLSVVKKTKAGIFPSITGGHIEDSDSSSAGSSSDSKDPKGKEKAKDKASTKNGSLDEDEYEDEDEDEDEEWEDVFQTTIEPVPEIFAPSSKRMGDLELTLEHKRSEIST